MQCKAVYTTILEVHVSFNLSKHSDRIILEMRIKRNWYIKDLIYSNNNQIKFMFLYIALHIHLYNHVWFQQDRKWKIDPTVGHCLSIFYRKLFIQLAWGCIIVTWIDTLVFFKWYSVRGKENWLFCQIARCWCYEINLIVAISAEFSQWLLISFSLERAFNCFDSLNFDVNI